MMQSSPPRSHLRSLGLVGTGAALRTADSANATPAAAIPTDGSIPDVAERVVDSVVNISIRRPRTGPTDFDRLLRTAGSASGDGTQVMGKGSGVIVTASGRILTNAHVVKAPTTSRSRCRTAASYDAKVVGKDPKADLAVIQLKGNVPPLKPIAFGDSVDAAARRDRARGRRRRSASARA